LLRRQILTTLDSETLRSPTPTVFERMQGVVTQPREDQRARDDLAANLEARP
jgi:hypothetical protein